MQLIVEEYERKREELREAAERAADAIYDPVVERLEDNPCE